MKDVEAMQAPSVSHWEPVFSHSAVEQLHRRAGNVIVCMIKKKQKTTGLNKTYLCSRAGTLSTQDGQLIGKVYITKQCATYDAHRT